MSDDVATAAVALEPARVELPLGLHPDPVESEFAAAATSGFHVRLENFEGPFDLLLSLIGRRQLDVTEVALSQVTDEFLTYLGQAARWDLGQATEFLVVAATLLDLKAARLLPAAEVDDEEDLALLEARDLLFARLLQYRAYKLAAAYLAQLERGQAQRHGRAVALDAALAQALPDVVIDMSPSRFAALAAQVLAPRPAPVVATGHVHAPRVSVREHMAVLRDRLRRHGASTFRALVADCSSTLEVVARFLGLLELYRDGVIGFDQADALAELRVRWIAGEWTEPSESAVPAAGAESGTGGVAAPSSEAGIDDGIDDEEYG